MKKLYLTDTPLELIEMIKENYFSRKEVSKLTGMSATQLKNLGARNIAKAEYFIYSDASYYSYLSLLELKLMAKIRATGKHRAFELVDNASKFLKKYTDNKVHICDKRIIYVNDNLYFYDYFNNNLISLTGHGKGNLTIKGIFDLLELEQELLEDARKNFINSFNLKANGYLSDEEIAEIDKYVIN